MNTCPGTEYPELPDSQAVDAYVRRVSDTIHDPCGMAMGIQLGMNEMGLIRGVDVASEGEDWNVHIVVRLTSPGCEYFFAFKDNLEQQLSPHPRIRQLTVEWDPTLDWSPQSLTPRAQKRLEQRRRELWNGNRKQGPGGGSGTIKLQAS